jgi:hypothetical protein
MRKFLRQFVNSICTVTSKSHPVTGKTHRQHASELLVTEVLPMLNELADLEDADSVNEDSTLHEKRSDIVTSITVGCQSAMPPSFKVPDAAKQRSFISLILAPRRVIGNDIWSSLLRLLVRKLPGGKHYLGAKGGIGSWIPYHDMYQRSKVHEADVLLYCFLMGSTCDNKLAQNFIAGAAQFKNFMKFHKVFLRLVEADKASCEMKESAALDCALASEVKQFVDENTMGSGKPAREHKSDDDEENEDEDLRLGDDDVMNLVANL